MSHGLSFHFSETVTKNGKVLVCGEITSSAKVDYEDVVRKVIKFVGYDDIKKGKSLKKHRHVSNSLPK